MEDNTKLNLNEYFNLVRESWVAHGRELSKPGFRAILVYYFGNWRMGIKYKLFRAPFSFVYRFMFRYVRNNYGIELPYTVRLGRRVIIEHQHGIVIHGNAEIGNDTIIRQGVTIGNRYLTAPDMAPSIGERVNIGAGTMILGEVTIGNDVAIGANSVVLKDVPEGSTVAGNPAKIIK